MFSILHTADWHLGQSFFGFDRDYEHQQFLQWLLKTLQTQRPDAMIVAGDIFDTINPSAIAQRRFYDFLAQVCQALPHLQIVITAGNHDSASRLESPSTLLESLRIKVVGTVVRDQEGQIDVSRFIVPLTDSQGGLQALVLAIPFLRPSDVPMLPNADDAYLDGIRELYRLTTEEAVRLREQWQADVPIVAMGHCHVMGGTESRDSERRIVIGGAEALGLDTFAPEVSYVALGHLHKAQQFQDGRVCYSGSPIPLSFSESGYRHRVLKLLFDHRTLVTMEDISIPRAVRMLTVPAKAAASVTDVLAELQQLDVSLQKQDPPLVPHQFPFLEVRLLDDGPDPGRRKRIEDAVENLPVRLASIKLEPLARESSVGEELSPCSLDDLRALNPEDIFRSVFRERYEGEPDEAVLSAFREIVAQLELADS